MPKDEIDLEDPLELNGVAMLTGEDTTGAMCECFVEEFMRMGHNPQQILALFRNPHYLGLHLVLQKRGEPFVRDQIAEIFARWGRPVTWPEAGGSRREEAQCSSSFPAPAEDRSLLTPAAATEPDPPSPTPWAPPSRGSAGDRLHVSRITHRPS